MHLPSLEIRSGSEEPYLPSDAPSSSPSVNLYHHVVPWYNAYELALSTASSSLSLMLKHPNPRPRSRQHRSELSITLRKEQPTLFAALFHCQATTERLTVKTCGATSPSGDSVSASATEDLCWCSKTSVSVLNIFKDKVAYSL